MKTLKEKVDDALIGMENPLEVYAEVVSLEKEIAKLKTVLLEDARTEFEKYGEKEVEAYGFKIAQTASGRYDYSECDTWKLYKERLKSIEFKMQLSYKMDEDFVDSDSGEVFPRATYKPNKVSLSFKKIR